MPRFTFEKFPETESSLTTQMKSVGEVMAIGRTFKESLQKAIRSLEIDSSGFESKSGDRELIREKLRVPNSQRLWYLADAFRCGMETEEIYEMTRIDPWFLLNIKQIINMEDDLRLSGGEPDKNRLKAAKEYGFSDIRIAELIGESEDYVRDLRLKNGIEPVSKMVDTCASEV